MNADHDRSEARLPEARRDPDREEKEKPDFSGLFVEVSKLRSRHDSLESKVSRLQERVEQLESFRDEFYYRRPETRGTDAEPPRASTIELSPIAPTPKWASSQPQSISSEPRLDALERAVTEALRGSDLGRLGSEELRSVVESHLGGIQLQTQPWGRQSPDGCQMLFLSSPQAKDGVLLVSPGELMDAEVAQYFEGEYGRRIRGCRRPALVRRSGNGFVVQRKGQVDIS